MQWVPGEDAHNLHILCHQGGCSTVGGFFDFSFQNSPYKIVQRTVFYAAGSLTSLKTDSGMKARHPS